MQEIITDIDELEIEEDTMSNKFLIFELDKQEYAIDIKYVVDIINIQSFTRVPNCPDFICGITNLRGKPIPIIDVRIRFGKSQQIYNDRTCIIAVELDGVSVGMVVDSVSEVITLEEDDVCLPPSFSQTVDTRFVEGIGKTETGFKLILDCNAVLNENNPPL